MSRATRTQNTETEEVHEVFFQSADTENGRVFIKIPESQAIEMGMTVIETTVEQVVVGVTGSEYLITEPRTFAFVEVTNDNRFEIVA